MEQYIVRLVQRCENDTAALEGSVEMNGLDFKKYFSTFDELHTILSMLESERGRYNVIWARD